MKIKYRNNYVGDYCPECGVYKGSWHKKNCKYSHR
jgi:hypothetical protein